MFKGARAHAVESSQQQLLFRLRNSTDNGVVPLSIRLHWRALLALA